MSPFLKQPPPRPHWWQRGVEFDIKRVAVSGNNLRGAIIGLLIFIGFVVFIGLLFAVTRPESATTALTVMGVTIGGMLAVTAAFVNVYHSSSVRHADILRRDFFDPVSVCKLLPDSSSREGAMGVFANALYLSDAGKLEPKQLRVDELGLFRYAFGHFEQYMGVKHAWGELGDALNAFNLDQRARAARLVELIRVEVQRLGLGLRDITDPAGELPGAGEYRSASGAWCILLALSSLRPEDVGGWDPQVYLDSNHMPPMLNVGGRPFAPSPSGLPTIQATKQILSRVAAGVANEELFKKRASSLAELENRTDALRRAARLASGHIEASGWVQASCEAGL